MQLLEELLDCAWNNTELGFVLEEEVQIDHGVLLPQALAVVVPVGPEHRVRFTAAGLAVCEDGRVEPFSH